MLVTIRMRRKSWGTGLARGLRVQPNLICIFRQGLYGECHSISSEERTHNSLIASHAIGWNGRVSRDYDYNVR